MLEMKVPLHFSIAAPMCWFKLSDILECCQKQNSSTGSIFGASLNEQILFLSHLMLDEARILCFLCSWSIIQLEASPTESQVTYRKEFITGVENEHI